MNNVARAGADGRAGRAAGEGGFLLVMVMVIMLIVSAIAASTLINSILEKSLATNQNYASIALQSAEAGVAVAQAWLKDFMDTLPHPMSDADFYTNAAKYNHAFPTLSGNLDRDLNGDGDVADPGEKGGTYTVTMRFKREWSDNNADGDCTDVGETSQWTDNDKGPDGVVGNADDESPTNACAAWPAVPSGEIVLYNRCGSPTAPVDKCFHFPSSRAKGTPGNEGYPLVEVTSTGTYGNASYRQIVQDLARNMIALPGVRGGITAAGGISFGPSAAQKKDGRNYKIDGLTLGHDSKVCDGTLGNDKPCVYVEAGMPLTIGQADTCFGAGGNVPEINTGAALTEIYTPWGAMGYNSEAEMEADPNVLTFAAGTDHAVVAAAIQPGVIVYYKGTDDFRPGSKRGVLVQKGRFTQHGGDTFTGLVVASGVNLVGTTYLIGAITTWDPTQPAVYGNGTMDIRYSCDALVMGVGNDGWEIRLAWQRVR